MPAFAMTSTEQSAVFATIVPVHLSTVHSSRLEH